MRLVRTLEGHWPQILRAGVDVVLDFGFWKRSARDRARALAEAVPAEHRLHWVRAADETAMARCLTRNERPGDNFLIDEAAYADLRRYYEEPGADERYEIVGR
jgi:predicted kinase